MKAFVSTIDIRPQYIYGTEIATYQIVLMPNKSLEPTALAWSINMRFSVKVASLQDYRCSASATRQLISSVRL